MTEDLFFPFGSCVSWRIPPANNDSVYICFFGHAQRLCTKGDETHSSMLMSPYYENRLVENINASYEYELSVTARINIFRYNPNSTVFDILAPTVVKAEVLNKLIHDTYGDVYAIWQTVMTGVRGIIEKFGIDARRLWNPFSWKGYCSEGMYTFLFGVAEKMKWQDLMDYMKEWNKDVFNSHDARLVLDFMVEKGYAIIIIGK